jgi:hypothetical protein
LDTQHNMSHCTLPLSISAILANETFKVPRLGCHRDLPHKILVDLNAQTRPLQRFHETILDSESFWVRDVAADVVFTRCAEQNTLVSKLSPNGYIDT